MQTVNGIDKYFSNSLILNVVAILLELFDKFK